MYVTYTYDCLFCFVWKIGQTATKPVPYTNVITIHQLMASCKWNNTSAESTFPVNNNKKTEKNKEQDEGKINGS